MKSLPNKPTQIKKEENQFCTYADLLSLVVKQPKQGGYDYTDIENRLAISQSLKNANGEINLEDAHFNYLKPLILSMKWSFIHEDLLTLKNEIQSIK